VVVSANAGEEEEAASQLFASALSLYLTFGSVVFIVLSGSSVASEREMVADSILCRPVTRYHYILSKLAALVLTVLSVYLLVTAPVGYLVGRYHPRSDLAVVGVAYGILSVGMVLATLVTLGVALSALFNNTILAVVVVALIWLSLGFIFSFLDITFLSPANLMEKLPRVVAGDFSAAEQWKIVGSFAGLMALFSTLAVLAFLRKDL
jgi:ABC-type transport system involved in multi-copper enzyme maturation permease subunit